jgi:hypothetical protein
VASTPSCSTGPCVPPADPASSAPNGIRTRAAALKGRCPRPLDDGGLRRSSPPRTRGARRRGPPQHRGRRPPRQSEWRGPICGDGGGHRTPSVTPVLGSILADSLALPLLLLLFVLAGVGGAYQQAAAPAFVQAMPTRSAGPSVRRCAIETADCSGPWDPDRGSSRPLDQAAGRSGNSRRAGRDRSGDPGPRASRARAHKNAAERRPPIARPHR